jgi:large subunit ribosomal protein L1
MVQLANRIKITKAKIVEDSYSYDSAIALLKDFPPVKFIESVEAHISLNIDPKYSDQQLRTTVILPKGTGKKIRIAVLANDEQHNLAKEAGAEIVGSDSLIDEINQGNLDFDLLIATPELMPKIAKLGRVLGPKGLMPSPKAGTVSTDLEQTINEFKKGKLEYRADKAGIVHLSFGKINFSQEDLIENLKAFYISIEQNKPSGVKGRYFKTFYMCTTMSPSIRIDLTSFD